jgi:hypothetical protein
MTRGLVVLAAISSVAYRSETSGRHILDDADGGDDVKAGQGAAETDHGAHVVPGKGGHLVGGRVLVVEGRDADAEAGFARQAESQVAAPVVQVNGRGGDAQRPLDAIAGKVHTIVLHGRSAQRAPKEPAGPRRVDAEAGGR